MSKLLIQEPPLQVLPSLAVIIGLNEAIFLQQLHYWLEVAKNSSKIGKQADGEWWIYNSVAKWQKINFPFWSVSTINRAIKSLERKKIVKSRSDLNKVGYDRTKWYTIDYEALRVKNAFSQNEQMEQVNLTKPIPETPSENHLHPEKPSFPGKQPKPNQLMFSALTKVCQIDLSLITTKQRGQFNQAEKKIRQNGYEPQDILNFEQWWYANDWRGKKKQVPTLANIREEWGKFRNGNHKNTNEVSVK